MGKPRRGDVIEVTITELDEKGNGLGAVEDYTVRVRGAIPGDCVRAYVWKLQHKTRQLDARKEAFVHTQIERQPPRCSHFGVCGGCVWQDVAYETQVRLKQDTLQKCLETSGIMVAQDVPIVCEQPFFYRNKMEFSFGSSPENPLELGLHIPGRFDRVFDLENCFLQSEQSNGIVRLVRAYVKSQGLSVYHLKRHDGLLRFLTIREGKNTNEIMVVLTTSGDDFPQVQTLADAIQKAFPDVMCFIHSINRRKAQVAVGDEERVLLNNGHIQESLGDFTFDISPHSFFQTNTHQAERLYQRVVALAAPLETERVLDVYCGTGGISLFLAQKARSVLGIEVVDAAIQDAVKNSARNGLENCTFMSGAAEDLLDQLRQNQEQFDVAVTDPPRVGMHPKALHALMELHPSRIVYVSCNPQALGRDLAQMEQAGYCTDYVQLVDMFPHTAHCEVLATLTAKA